LVLLIIGMQFFLTVPTVHSEENEKEDCLVCLNRERLNKILAITKSEQKLRLDLIDCRKEKIQVIETGWKPWIVITVSTVAILAVGTGTFFLGQEIAK